MRTLPVALLVLVLATVAWLLWPSAANLPPLPVESGVPAPDSPDPVPPRDGSLPKGPGSEVPAGLSPNTIATRTEAPSAAAEEPLAAEPTAWVRVLDQATNAPVPGAAIRASQSGLEFAYTDERGLAPLHLTKPQQLAVAADRYLLRMLPAQLDTTEREPQEVRLVRDRWTVRVRMSLRDDQGRRIDDAFVLCEPLGNVTPLAPPTDDAVIARAWREHGMLSRLPSLGDLGIEDGDPTQPRTHRLGDDGALQFVVAGRFRITAATLGGLVGAAECDVPAAGSTRVDLRLRAAPALTGTVVGPDGKPLADATVRLERGDPLGLVATTGPDGTFALAPLAERNERLHVRYLDYEALAFGPVSTRSVGLRIGLAALPAGTIRGRVRSRPDGEPLADAAVLWSAPGVAPSSTRTDAQGRFTLAASGSQPGRLFVQAKDHIPYAEMVEPGAPYAEYDVLPGIPEQRAARGMSALLCGAVIDGQGRPIAGVPIRWVPDAPTPPSDVPTGRRTLEGAVLDLPGLTTSGLDGGFRLETRQFGGGRLCLPEHVAQAARGLRTEAIAGETKNGLTLRR